MDIVYIFREWPMNSFELRYSLRSLKNIEHNKVYIVWDKPERVSDEVIHIQCDDPYTIKAMNALHKIKKIIDTKDISSDFILMNDDFILLDRVEHKNYNQGTILEHYKRRAHMNSDYVKLLKKTLELYPDWLDYSLHIPIIMNKSNLSEMIKTHDFSEWLLIRNIYWNMYIKDSEYMWDVKILERENNKLDRYLSTNDSTIKNRHFREYIDNLFPNMCKYEIYPLNYNIMKAKANYNVTIDGITYEKWKEYDIDVAINTSNDFGWEYFTLLWEKKEVVKSTVKKEEEVETKQDNKDEVAELREKYKEKFNKNAFPGWNAEQLKAKLS